MRSQAEVYDLIRDAIRELPPDILREVAEGGAGVADFVRVMRRAGLPADRIAAARQFMINNARARLQAAAKI